MVKRADCIEKVRPFIGLEVARVLTGIRRGGKSVLMERIRDVIKAKIDPSTRFVSVNLELDENKRFCRKAPCTIM